MAGNRFYSLDGVRIDEIANKSKPGQTRAPTIADARKHGWVPSATTVLGMLNKQAMIDAKDRLVTEAAFCYQPMPGETPEAYHDRIMQQALGVWDEKRDKGTEFHKAIENSLNDQEFDPAWEKHVAGARRWLIDNQITVEETEKVLVSRSHGYAGTTDVRYSRPPNIRGIGDFKTTTSKPGVPMKPWPSYLMQLPAYVVAQWGTIDEHTEGWILMVSINEPGRVEGFFYGEKELWWGWKGFHGLLDAWSVVNNYDPKGAVQIAAA